MGYLADTTVSFLWIVLLAGSGALVLFIYYSLYRRNVARLNAYEPSIVLKPRKARFMLSWSVVYLSIALLCVLVLWLIERNLTRYYFLPVLLLQLVLAPVAYPYYTIGISNGKLNGAALWGWLWLRVEIGLDEIDLDKVLRQKFGRKLGVTVIHSTTGAKILALGLDGTQVAKILEFSSKYNR